MVYYVTGATGFLGGRLVEMLLERGDQVIAFGRNMDELKRLEELGATYVRAEITDRRALSETMPEGCAVIHCAGISAPWGKEVSYYKTNVLGTQMVSSVALEKKVSRFIHISTPSLYISQRDRENVKESDPLPDEMINLYAETKLQAEHAIDHAVEVGLPAITLRPQVLFGPRDTSILPRLLRIARKGVIPVINPAIKIDMTFVDNVVEAIFCALEAPAQYIGEKYNVTNDEPRVQIELFEEILQRLGHSVKRKHIPFARAMKIAKFLEWTYRKFNLKGEPILTRYSVCVLSFSRTLDITKIKMQLGYRPKYSLEEGLVRTLPWFNQSQA